MAIRPDSDQTESGLFLCPIACGRMHATGFNSATIGARNAHRIDLNLSTHVYAPEFDCDLF